jgi:hypothetical protein
VPTDHEFVFIRSASATPSILRALNPQDRSNSSSLTSTNVSHLTSRPPENRKVGGSTSPLATPKTTSTEHAGPAACHVSQKVRRDFERSV